MRIEQVVHAGIVGAGQIASIHLAALRRISNVQIVGLFDRNSARAERASAELNIPAMPSLQALRHAGARVIHVLTPPHTHANLTTTALDLGCHVYVEKPAAMDVADCRAIANVAAARKLQVCVGHSLLFHPRVQRALRIVEHGKLGRVVSVDFACCSTYPPYAGGRLPKHFRSAGYPFRDLGAHALYLFEAFLGPLEHVQADWKSLGGIPNLAFDEWRAQVRCRDGLGQCQLSWNVRPLHTCLTIQGTGRVLRVELSDPKNQGTENLIAAFYRALRNGEPAPITVGDAKRVVQWTERVARLAEQDQHRRLAIHRLTERVPFLVTGATGALGRAIVARLRDEGRRVRIFVRRPPEAAIDGVEVAIGDLGDPDAVHRAVRGAETIIHAGAATRGSWPDFQCGTIAGTRNIVDACLANHVRKLVHVSSLAVLDLARADRAQPLREASRLERHPGARDDYARNKIDAERIVHHAAFEQRLPAVILRPGRMFGGGIPLLTSAIARQLHNHWIVLGNGEQNIPLIHIDDVVEAILRAAASGLEHGEIIHLIDDSSPTQNEVLAGVLSADARVVRLPRWIVIGTGAVITGALRAIGRSSPVSPYRLRSLMSRCTFASDQRDLLDGWRPTIGLHGGIHREVAHSRGRFARVVPAEELLIAQDLSSLGNAATTDPRA